ncbi:MAG: hypothetical protein COV29_01465 [Candidatus Yanofskybacteria bacterium CG10_big_fil_rev_8_21_14_0_10_36_16]|uniref:Glycosyltransferase 2-like domain-containing protein n=1 Tax=Candidatus Yanofskybacteria bacterium CG10_big_fil_rev_8_21_14_0_10_36_16 TaxID=1975096 RepID=A0A2J0Q9Z6_9BACT|nr:MAG: hypothetical protein COV29_01465 [Candidatus Yanofskybacteria bacterium CG10_big_fil_rev_8_21_14_0_10_36_16]
MSLNKQLSIIIVHYKTPELLRMCLRSINQALPSVGLRQDEYEVIVVDSASERISRDIVRDEFPSIKLLDYEENLGFAKGVNEGIINSSGEFVLILNADIVIPEGSVEKMLEYIKPRKDIAILAPQLLNFNDTIQHSYFSYYKPQTIVFRRSNLLAKLFGRGDIKRFLMTGTDENKIQTPDWVIGGAMMVRRKAIDEVGMMDERFFMYFEDVDWARRFWHNGYKVVYYPESKIYHAYKHESRSRFGLAGIFFNKKAQWHLKSAIKFFWKYRDLRKIDLKRRRI